MAHFLCRSTHNFRYFLSDDDDAPYFVGSYRINAVLWIIRLENIEQLIVAQGQNSSQSSKTSKANKLLDLDWIKIGLKRKCSIDTGPFQIQLGKFNFLSIFGNQWHFSNPQEDHAFRNYRFPTRNNWDCCLKYANWKCLENVYRLLANSGTTFGLWPPSNQEQNEPFI